VADKSEADFSSLWANAIFDFKMAALHSHLDSIAEELEYATSANWTFARQSPCRATLPTRAFISLSKRLSTFGSDKRISCYKVEGSKVVITPHATREVGRAEGLFAVGSFHLREQNHFSL
jgi:hypothetical protein